jgi:hypothetical protein
MIRFNEYVEEIQNEDTNKKAKVGKLKIKKKRPITRQAVRVKSSLKGFAKRS